MGDTDSPAIVSSSSTEHAGVALVPDFSGSRLHPGTLGWGGGGLPPVSARPWVSPLTVRAA